MGPSGVGKSTVLRAASLIRKDHSPEWFAPGEIGDEEHGSVRSVDQTQTAKLVNFTLEAIAASNMMASQKITATALLGRSARWHEEIKEAHQDAVLVHDELLLNRLYSTLLYSENYRGDAQAYLHLAPEPHGVVVAFADVNEIVKRVKNRSRNVNVYYGLTSEDMLKIVSRALEFSELAYQYFRKVRVPALLLDLGQPIERAAAEMHHWITEQRNQL